MRKTYIEILGAFFNDWHKDVIEQGHKISEFLDKTIIWIVGLSTGAIVLIFSSLDKLTFVPERTLNVTLSFLLSSIVFGILGKVLYAIALYIGYSFSALFTVQLKMLELPHKPRELVGDETSEMIYQYIQEDFKIDMPSILEQKKIVVVEKWPLVDENARKFYEEYSEWSSESIKEAMKEINKIIISTFGYKEDYFEKQKSTKNRVKGIVHRFFTYSSYTLYILSSLFFGLSLVYFIVNFILSR